MNAILRRKLGKESHGSPHLRLCDLDEQFTSEVGTQLLSTNIRVVMKMRKMPQLERLP